MNHTAPHLPPHLIIETQESWASKLTSARFLGHPLVWLGMTGLFILLGYLWLQYYARPLSEKIEREHTASELIGSTRSSSWNPDIYRPVTTRDEMSITRQADELRSQNYREALELENQIQPLLNQASIQMEAGDYLGNGPDNAWQNYQQVLEIDPEHKIALSGQAQIVGILQSNAEYAGEERQYSEAEYWLLQLDAIEKGAPFQSQLRQRIVEMKAEEQARLRAERLEAERLASLDEALTIADRALQATPPSLDAAHEQYQIALLLDPRNQSALEGIQATYRARADLATHAIARLDYAEVRDQIEVLMKTGADTKLIQEIESALQESQAQERRKREEQQAKLAAARAAAEKQAAASLPQTITPVVEPSSEALIIPDDRRTETPSLETAIEQGTAARPQSQPETESDRKGPNDIGEAPPAPSISSSSGPAEVTTIEIAKSPNSVTVTSSGKSAAPEPAPAQVPPAPIDEKSKQLAIGLKAYYAGNYNTALSRLLPLAGANSPRAQFRVGVMYSKGLAVDMNADSAMRWISRALPSISNAAQQGQAWAQADMGTVYELGIGVERDLAYAASWYEKSAKQGYAGGQANLGSLYGRGAGVKYDREKALYWFEKAAAQGNKIAKDNLFIMNAR